jgi:hypothetical protein
MEAFSNDAQNCHEVFSDGDLIFTCFESTAMIQNPAVTPPCLIIGDNEYEYMNSRHDIIRDIGYEMCGQYEETANDKRTEYSLLNKYCAIFVYVLLVTR